MPPTSQRRIIGLWVVGALLLLIELGKHGAILAMGQPQPWGDSTVYWRMAGDAAAGDWWLTADPVAFRTPGYPWFLAIWRTVADRYALLGAIATQHACVLATSLLVGWTLWQRTGSAVTGLLGWSIGVFSSARAVYANWLLTESLATLLLTASVALLILAVQRHRWQMLAAAGLCVGVGMLVRPSLVAVLPALLVVSWRVGRRSEGRPVLRLAKLLVGPAIALAVLLPWCGRNQQLFGRFTLCVFTGRELWTAHFSPWPGGELPIPEAEAGAELRSRIDERDLNLRHQWSVSDALRRSGLDDAESDELMQRVAWQAISKDPLQAAFRTAARCATFWYCWEWEVIDPRDVTIAQLRDRYDRQVCWGWPAVGDAAATILRWSPERSRAATVLGSLIIWSAVVWLTMRRGWRWDGLIIGSVLVTTTLLTAALEIPLYRYRSVLEPVCAIAVGLAVFDVAQSLSLRHRLSIAPKS